MSIAITKTDSIPQKIKKFIECLIPLTACNMNCHYCYIAQRGQRDSGKLEMHYSSEIIAKGLSKERLGGIAYISICGAGETLLAKELPEILLRLLQQGHYLNVTTNGTITEKFDRIIDLIPEKLISHLHFCFSFHYLELIRLKKMGVFFDNISKIKAAGCSFVVQVNLCDEYEPHIDEIKQLVEENTGAYPQLAATRDEINLHKDVRLYTSHTQKAYKTIGDSFESPLFEYTMKNFMVKRKEFCYAGEWSYVLNLATGILRSCYGSKSSQNIFKNVKTPIKLTAIGKHCQSSFCMNSTHFMAWGVIPEKTHLSYAELRNRNIKDTSDSWYTDTMYHALSQDLAKNNSTYTYKEKIKTEIVYYWDTIIFLIKKILKPSNFTKLFVFILKQLIPKIVHYELLLLMAKKSTNNYKKLTNQKKVYVFLAADYGNIGDVAITIAQTRIIKKKYPNFKLIDIPVSKTLEELKLIKKIYQPNDIVTIIGGGNMGDRYYQYELYREIIIKKMKLCKIVSFPQTIDFSDTRKGQKALSLAKRVYSKHSNLTILARENLSYSKMKKVFPNNKILMTPDIVLTLDYLKPLQNRSGSILCLRNDREKYLNSKQFDQIIFFITENYDKVSHYDTHIGKNNYTAKKLNKEFENILNTFSSAELVITDRLHGMIFCYITGTPAIVFPNDNYKIEKSFEWIKDCGFIEFTKQTELTQLKALAAKISNVNIDKEQFVNKQKKFENLILETL